MALNQEYIRKIEIFTEYMPKRIFKLIGTLSFEGFFTYDKLSYDEALKQPRNTMENGLNWGRKWEYGWFFATVEIPKECEGKRVVFKAELGESLVFVNGVIYGSLDKEHKEITLSYCAKAGERYDIVMETYAGHSGTDRFKNFMVLVPEDNCCEFPDNVNQRTIKNGNFGIINEEVFQLWMDIKTLYDLRNRIDEVSMRRATIDKGLKNLCDVVDIELPDREFLETVAIGREILRPLLECKNGTSTPLTYAVGHSHLDLEWHWTKEETRRKTVRTLGNQLKIIEEYPEYIYLQTQPWILETVKNEYPDVYKKVKKYVKSGNIVVDGGMWVEADTNIPSGESLIRQFIFGKRFIKDEFDVESRMLWLPDIFGVTASLPQIMKGCGIKYFMNAKITWLYNGGDALPHSNFMWQGIDDSKVLTNIIQEYATDMRPVKILEKWRMNPEKEDVHARLLPYGHGDGGGGATRMHLEYMRREKDLEGLPRVESKNPVEYFEYLENDCDIHKRYVGELYYAAHRGTYTSQAKTKKLNRRSEYALRETEMWSALFGNDFKKETDLLWKKVLFNQFHDIIPGSSIARVYEVAEKEYETVINKSGEITDKVLSAVTENRDDTITVFNSLSWDRNAYVELPDGYNSVFDAEGTEMPSQSVNGKQLASLNVPSCGYKSYRLGKKADNSETEINDSLVLENNCIRAEFDNWGQLISLVDKDKNIEFINSPSNVFRMYKDAPFFSDAWDIDSFYEKNEVLMDGDIEVIPECKGELYTSLVIKRELNNSQMVQRVSLKKDSRHIDFETEIEWNERHKLLKVDYNTNIHTEELISEVQFGYVKRPNHKNREYDADRFEVLQHKWSALAEGKRGIAIINDSKYGISADDGKMSLTLLKSAAAPDLYADKGTQMFTYSIMPFGTNICDSKVVNEAYECNVPCTVLNGYAEEKSYIKVSQSNVIIDTVKQAEDSGDDIIIRMYEAMNTYTECNIEFDFDIREVYETDMMENNIGELKIDNRTVNLKLKAFEIKTLRIRK